MLYQNLVYQILSFIANEWINKMCCRLQCSAGEISQERAHQSGFRFWAQPPPHIRFWAHPLSQDTSRAPIEGLDQKLPYLVFCPPVITKCARITISTCCQEETRKCKLPNPEEGALKFSDVQTWHPLWMLRNNFAYLTAWECPHIDPDTKTVLFTSYTSLQ